MKTYILDYLSNIVNGYSVCGIVDRQGRIYPLGSDSKVISTIFEIIVRQAVASYASSRGLALYDADKQNYYPDFTLARDRNDNHKIAIDVKTTYRTSEDDNFAFTLGSYTSFLRNDTKNIMFPYGQYAGHWIIGFVYRRAEVDPEYANRVYSPQEVADIPTPFTDVEVFMQEKWRIAGDKAGSGNTTNIGSTVGTLSDFQQGAGVFHSEDEFLEYWRGYGRTAAQRASSYRNVGEFRARPQP